YALSVLGTKERVANVPRDSVYAYYKRYYAPNNMTMVIVGDFDAKEALQKVKENFADFPSGWDAKDNYAKPPKRDKVAEIRIEKDVNQAYLMMSTIGPMVESPDQFPLDLMANILGSGESSRFWKKLQNELGLVYSANYSFYTNKYEGMLFSFATLDPENLTDTEAAINEILVDIKKNGFTEKELRKAKNALKTNHYLSMERGLDKADNYAQYDSYVGYQFIENYPESIEKVTLTQLNEAAQKYLNTDSYVKTMVVPK
ncbi:MAG: insulinase family protein, partial [candidate division Zixibacteria bacterium]|nr:insulinase family protein [candidate division Zixibacteria bacterium]